MKWCLVISNNQAHYIIFFPSIYILQLNHMGTDPINEITSFKKNKFVKPLHPLLKMILSMNEIKHILNNTQPK